MPRMGRTLRGLVAALSRFGHRREGATAVEFALVAGPFLLLILATMEIAMLFWSGEVLENAVAKASRKIYTGEFQTDSANSTTTNTNPQLQAKLRKAICDEVAPLIKCDQTLAVDVQQISAFSKANLEPPITNKIYDTSSYGYAPVGARQIGLVTASVEYKTFFPSLAGTKLANGNRVIMATAAFRAEPYAN
jgi:Flp pilus assembly protein TadG